MKPRLQATVLVADDDPGIRRALGRILQDYEVHAVGTAEAALGHLATELANVVLLDLAMPGMGGERALVEIRNRHPGIEVIIITGQGTIELAVQCMRHGAFDFITKPFEPLDRVTLSVERALERQRLRLHAQDLQRELTEQRGFKSLIGSSPAMQAVLETARAVAPRDSTVLIEGESGTGKELVARGIHLHSPRREAAFVPVNCGALPVDVVESELFGHVKGAFTGAVSDAPGLFREADGGTLFLDEIGELSPTVQVKLLRVLQDQEVRPVGSAKSVQVDVRLVAATNRDLQQQVEGGSFRSDLYYRLAVVPVRLPPLRERPGDVIVLFDHFWARLTGQSLGEIEIDGAAREALETFHWPGNVRELQNVVERVHISAALGPITVDDLPAFIRGEEQPTASGEDTPLTLQAYEKLALTRALRENNGDVSATAGALGISRATLYRKLRSAGLTPTEFQG